MVLPWFIMILLCTDDYCGGCELLRPRLSGEVQVVHTTQKALGLQFVVAWEPQRNAGLGPCHQGWGELEHLTVAEGSFTTNQISRILFEG